MRNATLVRGSPLSWERRPRRRRPGARAGACVLVGGPRRHTRLRGLAEGAPLASRREERGTSRGMAAGRAGATTSGPPAVKLALDLIDSVREQVRKHPQDLVLATTVQEVRNAHQQGKIAVLMGVEGGHMIDNDPHVLRQFAALGVRYMTLTHTLNTDWAGSSGEAAKNMGLTPFGKDIVREMNRLGVMVDISHVSDKTSYDALEVSKAPMIASHSSCRAICDAPRNMTDDMIKALAAKGGVIQINYHVGFLSQAYRDASLKSEELKTRTAAAEKEAGSNEAVSIRADEAVAHQMMAEGKLPTVGWEANRGSHRSRREARRRGSRRTGAPISTARRCRSGWRIARSAEAYRGVVTAELFGKRYPQDSGWKSVARDGRIRAREPRVAGIGAGGDALNAGVTRRQTFCCSEILPRLHEASEGENR